MKNHLKYFLFILISFLLVNCSGFKKTTVPRNLEMIYNPNNSSVHPQIKVYNISDTISILVERIRTKELLFNQANKENKLLARIKVIYNLYNLDEKERLIDSSSFIFRFEKDKKIQYHNIEIPVNTEIGKDYILEIITIDQNRKNEQYSFCRIDRTGRNSKQDFLLTGKFSNEYLTNSFINDSSKFKIRHYKYDFDSLTVFYFNKISEVPVSPYFKDTIPYNFDISDTSWTCYLDSIDYNNFNKEGIYYFTSDQSPQNGFSLFHFGNNFPYVRTTESLIKPLKYLDFNDTISKSDSIGKYTKLMVDNFWLDKAENIDKSRDLIKMFYNRVMYANSYFTSFVEGWQTDRGMIYIIYGLPDYIFKSDIEEKWIYNPIDLGPGLSFRFKYYKNPISLNHYNLDRQKLKATNWDSTIKMWNTGEVFYYQK